MSNSKRMSNYRTSSAILLAIDETRQLYLKINYVMSEGNPSNKNHNRVCKKLAYLYMSMIATP